MSSQTKLNIGLYGFGVVGASLYEVLTHTTTLKTRISRVCIRHADKKRSAPAALFTTDRNLILDDPEINVVVELTSDPVAAYYIVTTALRRGKAVVSANKKMIAEHLEELIELQLQYKVPLLYEASCCASIPVIRNLEEYYDNDLLHSIRGIVNGSTNYILTRIAEGRNTYEGALAAAQAAGFAEADPSLDVRGTDAANKLSILLAHAYGVLAHPEKLLYTGIVNLHKADSIFAREKGYEIRLVAQARKLKDGKVAAFVLPQFVGNSNMLYEVKQEYNGVEIESSLSDKQFFCGKGAGGYPTASAVLNDLSALRYDYRYEYKKLRYNDPSELSTDFYLRVCISFKNLIQVAHERFARVEEWSSSDTRCHITGIIHYSQLQESNWWQQPGVSLIVYPEGIVEHFLPVRMFEEEFAEV